jgi:hypothetical protein
MTDRQRRALAEARDDGDATCEPAIVPVLVGSTI